MQEIRIPEKILVIDDDPTVGEAISEMLKRHNVKVLVATNLDTALYQFNQNRFDAVLVELEFEPMLGLVLIQKWRNHEVLEKRFTGFVLISGNQKGHKAGELALLGELADIELLSKPVKEAHLLTILSKAKAAKLRSMKYDEVRQNVLRLSADSSKIDKVMQLIDKQMKDMGNKGLDVKAEIYENHNQLDQALSTVEQLIEKDPKQIGWLNLKGRLLLKKGDHKEALKVMEVADREAPNNIERINALAMAYLQNNQPEKSVEKMKQMIDLNPEHPDMKFDLFAKLYDFGFNQHALDLCKKTTGPLEVVRYYNNKGVALSKVGNVEGALTEYERSLQYYPKFKENYRIMYNIALAHAGFKQHKNYIVALEYLDKCLALEPNFEKALNTRATILKILEKIKAS